MNDAFVKMAIAQTALEAAVLLLELAPAAAPEQQQKIAEMASRLTTMAKSLGSAS